LLFASAVRAKERATQSPDHPVMISKARLACAAEVHGGFIESGLALPVCFLCPGFP